VSVDDNYVAVIAAIIAGAVGFATGRFSFARKGEGLRVHLVEISIGILRSDPKEDWTPARAWAIEVIEKNSGVKFMASDRAALLHKPIGWDGRMFGDIDPAVQSASQRKFIREFIKDASQPSAPQDR
jgi:hypothetical protein